jgi:hypothetical protein
MRNEGHAAAGLDGPGRADAQAEPEAPARLDEADRAGQWRLDLWD